ncbi:unnamed protein product [Chrysodeixis includens]|uniref:Uncharacterized protein n=1 Tax=Chrysodeixis includens TaxID=689277 RepID=A0A9N8KT19_CHRIL|nr:unnamed protein product [Chrysodeixis includens]
MVKDFIPIVFGLLVMSKKNSNLLPCRHSNISIYVKLQLVLVHFMCIISARRRGLGLASLGAHAKPDGGTTLCSCVACLSTQAGAGEQERMSEEDSAGAAGAEGGAVAECGKPAEAALPPPGEAALPQPGTGEAGKPPPHRRAPRTAAPAPAPAAPAAPAVPRLLDLLESYEKIRRTQTLVRLYYDTDPQSDDDEDKIRRRRNFRARFLRNLVLHEAQRRQNDELIEKCKQTAEQNPAVFGSDNSSDSDFIHYNEPRQTSSDDEEIRVKTVPATSSSDGTSNGASVGYAKGKRYKGVVWTITTSDSDNSSDYEPYTSTSESERSLSPESWARFLASERRRLHINGTENVQVSQPTVQPIIIPSSDDDDDHEALPCDPYYHHTVYIYPENDEQAVELPNAEQARGIDNASVDEPETVDVLADRNGTDNAEENGNPENSEPCPPLPSCSWDSPTCPAFRVRVIQYHSAASPASHQDLTRSSTVLASQRIYPYTPPRLFSVGVSQCGANYVRRRSDVALASHRRRNATYLGCFQVNTAKYSKTRLRMRR